MNQVIFTAEGKKFKFPLELIPRESLLYTFITTDNKIKKITIDDTIHIDTDFDKEQFVVVYNYLIKNVLPDITELYILDYFCINEFHSYELASLKENHMRKCMYLSEFTSHEMNTNNLYELITIDEKYWSNLKVPEAIQKPVLYDFNKLIKREWSNIKDDLVPLKEIIDTMGGNCIIAGGKVFNTLFDTKINNSDFDIFIYGCTQEEALGKIQLLSKHLNEKYFNDRQSPNECKIVRTANAITMKLTLVNEENDEYDGEYTKVSQVRSEPEYQIIFRLYRTASEVLHGFDVDCCSMGYDGTNVIATKRCIYSLINGYNTVNFERMSPSYELRLAKYGSRGMAIHVPGLKKDKINAENMVTFHKELLESYKAEYPERKQYDRYIFINQLKGLDVLLYLEYRLEQYKFNRRVINSIRKLCEEGSDYSSKRYVYQNDEGNYIDNLISWLYRGYRREEGDSLIEKLNEMLPGIIDLEFDPDGEYEGVADKNKQLFLKYAVSCKTNTIRKPSYGGTNMTFSYLEFVYGRYRRSETLDHVIDMICNFPVEVYNILKVVKPWTFEPKVTFKTTNPGEQMTNTFNKSVYDNHDLWFFNQFYKN